MLGLRKFDGINLDEFKEKFNVLLEDVYDIDDLVRDGYLIKKIIILKLIRNICIFLTKLLLECLNNGIIIYINGRKEDYGRFY